MPPTIATSLKLSAELKVAIDQDAKKRGMSSHAYMVKTLADTAERARLRERFHQDSLEALREMEETGLGYDWEEVKTYLHARVTQRDTPRPPLRSIR